jgi:hypothetical protein
MTTHGGGAADPPAAAEGGRICVLRFSGNGRLALRLTPGACGGELAASAVHE